MALEVFLLLVLAAMSNSAHCLDNGLARTPPMGWLNWERFTCQLDCAREPANCISARLFTEIASRLVDGGYRELGYTYVNVDDCWSEMERSPHDNRLVANSSRFPHGGISGLAGEMHARGLKLGLYGDCGLRTCAGYPAQLNPKSRDHLRDNYFELDASTLAGWRVDSFKFDGCHIDPLEAESICPQFAAALKRQSRPILLTCEWPFYLMYAHAKPDFQLAADSCNLWRYYDDIEDGWLSILNTIDYTVAHQATILKYHGPSHWFDPDQLVVGNFGLSLEQQRAQMALWCVWAAPLFMSNDLRAISPEAESILKNRRLIEVNQDEWGLWGQMVRQSGDGQWQAFVKPVGPTVRQCPSFALVYLNRNTLGNRQQVSFNLGDLLAAAPLHEAARRQRRPLEEVDGDRIVPAECRRQILAGEIQFKLVDLFEDPEDNWRVQSNAELSLLVAPNGVRAVKLEPQNHL